jgi:hypothetical protein
MFLEKRGGLQSVCFFIAFPVLRGHEEADIGVVEVDSEGVSGQRFMAIPGELKVINALEQGVPVMGLCFGSVRRVWRFRQSETVQQETDAEGNAGKPRRLATREGPMLPYGCRFHAVFSADPVGAPERAVPVLGILERELRVFCKASALCVVAKFMGEHETTGDYANGTAGWFVGTSYCLDASSGGTFSPSS